VPALAMLLRVCPGCVSRGRKRSPPSSASSRALFWRAARSARYHPPEQTFAATSSLKALGDHGANGPLETTKWWPTLHDRELDALIDRAIAASPTLEIALDRLQQARAQEVVVIGAALPMARGTAGGGWGSGSDLARGRASQTLVSAENTAGSARVVNLVGFDAAWEIDVFGKFRRDRGGSV
jgi:outer membrane protein TolC